MSQALAGVLRGLPGLAGVLAGIFLYAKPIVHPAPIIPTVILLFLIVALYASRELFTIAPKWALLLLEPWVLSAVCIVALSTQFLFWLTVTSQSWFDLPKPQLDAISGALLGAVTTFLATAWTKDVQDSQGPFLPSSQFRTFLAARFIERYKLTGDNVEVEACDSDVVASECISGWGLKSRWKRAAILSAGCDRKYSVS
jgi:hypothetical protein